MQANTCFARIFQENSLQLLLKGLALHDTVKGSLKTFFIMKLKVSAIIGIYLHQL